MTGKTTRTTTHPPKMWQVPDDSYLSKTRELQRRVTRDWVLLICVAAESHHWHCRSPALSLCLLSTNSTESCFIAGTLCSRFSHCVDPMSKSVFVRPAWIFLVSEGPSIIACSTRCPAPRCKAGLSLSLDLGTRVFDFIHKSSPSILGQSTEMENDCKLSNAVAKKSRQWDLGRKTIALFTFLDHLISSIIQINRILSLSSFAPGSAIALDDQTSCHGPIKQ